MGLVETLISTTANMDELILDVPREWMTKFSGFTMDTGGSVMKIVYRHKKDWEELKDSDKGRLRFMSFSRADRDKALDVLKENCYMTGNEGDQKAALFTTGVGSFQFSKQINEVFNAKLENIAEFDCFVKAFNYLISHIPIEQLSYPACTEEEEKVQKMMKEMMTMFSGDSLEGITSMEFSLDGFEKLANKTLEGEETGMLDPDDVFPCMLAMCGSGFGFMKIEKDGSFQCVELMNRGGRSFMAYGSLLTGASTYDELTDLAEKGNPYNIHYNNSDIAKDAQGMSGEEEAAGGLYSMGADMTDTYMYLMGKAAGKGIKDFSREDLAAAHLQTFANDVAQCLHSSYQKAPFKRVFWCGSFIKAEIVRRYLTLELKSRAVTVGMLIGQLENIPITFLKHGPYLGALGCVINSVDQFLKPPSEVAADKADKADNEEVTHL